jgi:cytochrome b subunit of formate dehydrogenase
MNWGTVVSYRSERKIRNEYIILVGTLLEDLEWYGKIKCNLSEISCKNVSILKCLRLRYKFFLMMVIIILSITGIVIQNQTSIYLSTYGSTALVDLSRFFSFLILYTFGSTPWRGGGTR